MKKITSLLLALVLMFSMSTVAFAATTGSITINNIQADSGIHFDLYKLLDLESYDATSGAYSYKVNADWAGFFVDNTDPEVDDAMNYVDIDAAGYVTWKSSVAESAAAKFASLAIAYAKANKLNPVKTTRDGDMAITGTVGKFTNLELGYYLIDSTVGTLCGLTTTNPNASVNTKNGIPSLDKQVEEDSTGNWGDNNTADIGQTVYFHTTIDVAAGAEDYVLHDKMSEGLTFQKVTKVELVKPGSTANNNAALEGTDYVVKTTTDLCDQGCDFEVVFTDAFMAKLSSNDKIIVHYNAMLNRDAVINGNGNPNETWLEYGEGNFTTHDTTVTYTFKLDIVKTDSGHNLINGAKFKIYNAQTGGEEVAVVPLMEDDNVTPVLDDKGNPIYRRARAEETGVEIEVKDGVVTVIGFDNGTYWLEETAAPDGYNKLTERQRFIINNGNLDAIFNDGVFSSGSGVHVVNKTGSMLPETGAMGTMMFITFGMIVVLGAGVLLVTKKRMSMIED